MIVDLRHRRGLDHHFRPIGVEFFGEDQRQSRADALPHFDGRRDDGDRAVGSDAHEGVECGRTGLSRRLLRRELESKAEGEASRTGEHATTGKIEVVVHWFSPPAMRVRRR